MYPVGPQHCRVSCSRGIGEKVKTVDEAEGKQRTRPLNSDKKESHALRSRQAGLVRRIWWDFL